MIIKPPPTIRTSTFLWLARSLSLSSSPTLVRNPKECWRPPPWNYFSVVCVCAGNTLRAGRKTVKTLLWNSWLEITNSWHRMHFRCDSSCVRFVLHESLEESFRRNFFFKRASLNVCFKNSKILRYLKFIFYSQINPWYRKCNFPEEILSIS